MKLLPILDFSWLGRKLTEHFNYRVNGREKEGYRNNLYMYNERLIIEWKRKRRENEGYRKYVYVRDIGGGASTWF